MYSCTTEARYIEHTGFSFATIQGFEEVPQTFTSHDPTRAKDFKLCYRMDGRVELVCKHGVGHPSRALQVRTWQDHDGIHGCDGCCGGEDFIEAERMHE